MHSASLEHQFALSLHLSPYTSPRNIDAFERRSLPQALRGVELFMGHIPSFPSHLGETMLSLSISRIRTCPLGNREDPGSLSRRAAGWRSQGTFGDGQRERESQEGQGELCSLRLKRSEVIGVESGLERL